MLTLVFTPSLLALRIWVVTYVVWIGRFLVKIGAGKSGRSAQDWALRRAAKQQKNTEIVWSENYLASNMAGIKNMQSSFNLDAKTQAAE
jgi:multidrug efflux pump